MLKANDKGSVQTAAVREQHKPQLIHSMWQRQKIAPPTTHTHTHPVSIKPRVPQSHHFIFQQLCSVLVACASVCGVRR
jgi:hypothetical protein